MAHCQAMRGGVTKSEAAIIADLQAAERSRDELAREVRPYLRHEPRCEKRRDVDKDCTCGLDALLSRLDGGGK